MSTHRRFLEPFATGLLIALFAPPFAACGVFIALVCRALRTGEAFGWGPGGVFESLIGMTTGAYFLIALPAFVGGVALPSLRRKLSSGVAVGATGLLGALAFVVTSRGQFNSEPVELLVIYAVPVASGIFAVATAAIRIKTRTEA